jgi:hypothetical protein
MTAPFPACAADEKTPDECTKYLDEMESDLNTLENLVPNVPPEEASYLEKEYSAAIQSLSGQRIYGVEQRSFFAAWNLHNAFDEAREQLKLSRPSVSVLHLKMKIQMASLIPWPMTKSKPKFLLRIDACH